MFLFYKLYQQDTSESDAPEPSAKRARSRARGRRTHEKSSGTSRGGELGVVEEDAKEVVDKVVGKNDYKQKKTLNNVWWITNSNCRYLIFTQLTYY